jgi:chemotaxis protein histidine kinase CheA
MGQGEDARDDGDGGVEQVLLTETTLEEIVAETPEEVEEETAAENAKEMIEEEAIHESEMGQGSQETLHVQVDAEKEKEEGEAAESSEADAMRRLEENKTAKDDAEKVEVEDDAEARLREEETESIRVEEVGAETKRLEEEAESIRLEEEAGMVEDIRLAEEARLVDDQRRAQVVEEELRLEEKAESIRLEEEEGMAEDRRLAEEARMHAQEVEAQARRSDEDDARAAEMAGSSETGDANCAADRDRAGPRSSPVIGGPLRVTLLLSAESYPAGVISLAGELRNRGHQVAFVGDARIWSRVEHLAPRGATFTDVETQSPPMDLLDSLTDIASMLPPALAPIVAQIQWIQQAYNSQVGALGLAKLRPDVLVVPPVGTGLYDIAESEVPGARIVVLQTLSPKLVVVGAPSISTDPLQRIVNAFWSGVNPLLHAAPTIFANYHRQARGLPLLADHHDYWMRHVNILPIPSSPATGPNLM